jgi:hypothetical protein
MAFFVADPGHVSLRGRNNPPNEAHRRAHDEFAAARTAPTLPRHTSATIRSKPARWTPPAAERPRSSSMISISNQPSTIRVPATGGNARGYGQEATCLCATALADFENFAVIREFYHLRASDNLTSADVYFNRDKNIFKRYTNPATPLAAHETGAQDFKTHSSLEAIRTMCV